jgi:hypothetical protein
MSVPFWMRKRMGWLFVTMRTNGRANGTQKIASNQSRKSFFKNKVQIHTHNERFIHLVLRLDGLALEDKHNNQTRELGYTKIYFYIMIGSSYADMRQFRLRILQ